MNESKTEAAADALIFLLKSSLNTEGSLTFGHLVLYTSFGVVKGRTGLSFIQGLTDQGGIEPNGISPSNAVIELNEVTVEHYSNHLPTASFDRLYIRLSDVQGFALINPQGQG